MYSCAPCTRGRGWGRVSRRVLAVSKREWRPHLTPVSFFCIGVSVIFWEGEPAIPCFNYEYVGIDVGMFV